MSEPTITRIRECVRSLNYVVSIHAAEELDDDNITILDLENIILSGEIIERQRDTRTREVKCVVRGLTLDERHAETVVKIGPTGKLFVITVYLA
ncbi:MAG: DUF4258 domain-containing protein [Candidatus Competibacter sp.]|nr:DUF4258 domain-containing protein [Candidatus Competibacter sp.]